MIPFVFLKARMMNNREVTVLVLWLAIRIQVLPRIIINIDQKGT